jgi:anti-anti-sigma regulatory factor
MTEPRSAADRIELTGAITIREIESVRRDLLPKLALKTPLEIDMSGVTEADISIVQLIIAAEKSAGAALRLLQPYPEAVQQVLTRSGLDAAGASLWTPRESNREN